MLMPLKVIAMVESGGGVIICNLQHAYISLIKSDKSKPAIVTHSGIDI